MTDVAYVTQEMWDKAQNALRTVLNQIPAPLLMEDQPRAALRRLVAEAIYPSIMAPEVVTKHYPCGCSATGRPDIPDYCSVHATP